MDVRSVPFEADFKSSGESTDTMAIGEVARRAGLHASAIRYYERVGVLPKPKRRGGRRFYDASVLDALAMVRFAKHVGFSLAQLKELLAGRAVRPDPDRWRALADVRLRDIEALIADAELRRESLKESLERKCPRLVERGNALLQHGVTAMENDE